MKLINKILLAIYILDSLCVFSAHAAADKDDEYHAKFQKVFQLLSQEYVDPPDKQKMLDAALQGMVHSLDGHSAYFKDDELDETLMDIRGEFGGIGVVMIYDSGVIKVISPIDELPADRAGIQPGDYIIGVDKESVIDLGFQKAAKNIKGTPGTKVTLVVLRKGEHQPKEYELTREIVKIHPVKTKLDDGVLYIRITTFNDRTTEELQKTVTEFLSKNQQDTLQGIILDLRSNPGGLLKQALSVSEHFLKSGLIVSIKGRGDVAEGEYNVTYNSNGKIKDLLSNLPLVTLINSGSASASEIVAGAIQDNKRGVILGTQSFGKGSVQTMMSIDERSGIKFTTAKYYTPSGRSIHKKGITPDIMVVQAKVQYPDAKKEEDMSLRNSTEEYFEKNNKIENKKTDSSKGQKKDVAKDSEKDKNKDEEKDDQLVKRELSEMYKKDFQYARGHDLVKSLHILNSASKQ